MSRGKLVAFEGIDNSGKDSAMLYFKRTLNNMGYRTTIIPSVTDTQLGRLIRMITTYRAQMRPNNDQLVPMFIADFYNKLEMIEEALVNYDIVLCSRWYTTTLAYCDRTTDMVAIEQLIHTDIKPDVLFYLQISIKTSLSGNTNSRENIKPNDIYTNKMYLTKAKETYDNILNDKYNTVIIDGELSKDTVYKRIETTLKEKGIINGKRK